MASTTCDKQRRIFIDDFWDELRAIGELDTPEPKRLDELFGKTKDKIMVDPNLLDISISVVFERNMDAAAAFKLENITLFGILVYELQSIRLLKIKSDMFDFIQWIIKYSCPEHKLNKHFYNIKYLPGAPGTTVHRPIYPFLSLLETDHVPIKLISKFLEREPEIISCKTSSKCPLGIVIDRFMQRIVDPELFELIYEKTPKPLTWENSVEYNMINSTGEHTKTHKTVLLDHYICNYYCYSQEMLATILLKLSNITQFSHNALCNMVWLVFSIRRSDLEMLELGWKYVLEPLFQTNPRNSSTFLNSPIRNDTGNEMSVFKYACVTGKVEVIDFFVKKSITEIKSNTHLPRDTSCIFDVRTSMNIHTFRPLPPQQVFEYFYNNSIAEYVDTTKEPWVFFERTIKDDNLELFAYVYENDQGYRRALIWSPLSMVEYPIKHENLRFLRYMVEKHDLRCVPEMLNTGMNIISESNFAAITMYVMTRSQPYSSMTPEQKEYLNDIHVWTPFNHLVVSYNKTTREKIRTLLFISRTSRKSRNPCKHVIDVFRKLPSELLLMINGYVNT